MKRLFLLIPFFLLAGCATDGELGGGRYLHAVVAQDRSVFGTNGGGVVMQNCKREEEKYNYAKYSYSDCYVEKAATVISSPGAGGMIVGGALIGVGAGVGGALSDAGGAVSNAVSSSSAAGGGHR